LRTDFRLRPGVEPAIVVPTRADTKRFTGPIPVNSILVFEPTDQKRCVSEFRMRLLIKKNGKVEPVPEFGYDDPGSGMCLTKCVFHCIDSNSRPLDSDSS
jgi:hypothetical protein